MYEKGKRTSQDLLYYYSLKDLDFEANRQIKIYTKKGAFVISLGAFITLSIVAPFKLIHVLSILCLVNIIFDEFIAYKIAGERFEKMVDIYCVATLMISLPIQWFGIGGLHGAGALWIIFTAVYCLFTVYGNTQRIMMSLFSLESIAIIVINVRHPELEASLSTLQYNVITVVSFVGISTFVQRMCSVVSEEFYFSSREMEDKQDDLNAHYQESRALNEELSVMTEDLRLANETQRRFTASMNHELRAPLNGIEGCLQILLLSGKLDEESAETVKNAITASKTINQTVNDLLDFAKLEEGKFEILSSKFDLRDVLDNITTIFRPQASAKNLTFQIKIPKNTRVSMVGDGVRVQQIMTNLISNGIKYTQEGSVTMTVTTVSGVLNFDVTDTGQGMTQEQIDVLFDPFTRFNLEDNAKIQGTGLGMNIVANLIKEMNGVITVSSEVGKGTHFRVSIPIMYYDSLIFYSTPREKMADALHSSNLNGLRILCVDDTQINRTVFKGLLKQTGAIVDVVDSGKRAIDICESEKYDVIFLDHMMPDMDGIETMEALRISGLNKETPAVMLTGNKGEEYQKLYREHGAKAYVMKPILFEELIDAIKMAIA